MLSNVGVKAEGNRRENTFSGRLWLLRRLWPRTWPLSRPWEDGKHQTVRHQSPKRAREPWNQAANVTEIILCPWSLVSICSNVKQTCCHVCASSDYFGQVKRIMKGKESVLAALCTFGCDVYFGLCFHSVLLVRHDEITQCRKEVVHDMRVSSGSKKLQ